MQNLNKDLFLSKVLKVLYLKKVADSNKLKSQKE